MGSTDRGLVIGIATLLPCLLVIVKIETEARVCRTLFLMPTLVAGIRCSAQFSCAF